jgi:phosphatidylserine decarboxylase
VLGGIVVSVAAIAGLYQIGLERLGWVVAGLAVVLCAWCAWFFRDPARRIPAGKDLVICPADGRVVMVGPADAPAELGLPQGTLRIAVFMNVFNVHVNRSPVEGVVDAVSYRAGKFFNASLDKASVDNERLGIVVRRSDGVRIGSVQIAGLVARRIVCRVAEGAALRAGERYGLIRFGSRVDVYVPGGSTVLAKVGDRTVAGETVLAKVEARDVPEAGPAGA